MAEDSKSWQAHVANILVCLYTRTASTEKQRAANWVVKGLIIKDMPTKNFFSTKESLR